MGLAPGIVILAAITSVCQPRAKLPAKVANSQIKGEKGKRIWGRFANLAAVSSFIAWPLRAHHIRKLPGKASAAAIATERKGTREFRSRGPRVSTHDGYTLLSSCCARWAINVSNFRRFLPRSCRAGKLSRARARDASSRRQRVRILAILRFDAGWRGSNRASLPSASTL